jgi:5-deoxy-glucuronate isomerase
MSDLAVRRTPSEVPGVQRIEVPLRHLRVDMVRLSQGTHAELTADGDERLVVVLEAPENVSLISGSREFELPARTSVFDQRPSALYLPPGHPLVLGGDVLAVVFGAEADPEAGLSPYVILPDDIASVVRGRENFQRTVRDILPTDRPATRLLAGETLNPAGNWSSSPPHKHDRHVPPEESELEEVYVFRVDPPQGFGLQLSYTTNPPAEAAMTVRDLDVVGIPRGYHPVAAAPGYRLYYLWCLAGRGRELHWRTDPAHAWLETP